MYLAGQPYFVVFIGVISFLLIFKILWYGRLWLRLRNQTKPNDKNLPPISIIVAARNEAENLMELIPAIFQQDYPEFEVVVVDDCSYDNTQDVLIALESRYPKLKKTFVKESNKFQGGKKFALTIAIKSANYEHLVFTDADCRPSSTNWLKHFGRSFSKGNNLVIGYGGFYPQKSLVNILVRTDTLQIALDYFAAIVWRMPYMAVGRNFGYTKSLFFKHKGFAKHAHLKSGDDDLFVNQVAKDAKTDFILAKEAITLSKSETSFSAWFNQKKRHVSTFKFYPLSKKTLLSFLLFSRLLIYISFAFMEVLFPTYALTFIPIFIGLWMVRMILSYLPAKSMTNLTVFWRWPLLEPLVLMLQLVFPVLKQFDKEISWKH